MNLLINNIWIYIFPSKGLFTPSLKCPRKYLIFKKWTHSYGAFLFCLILCCSCVFKVWVITKKSIFCSSNQTWNKCSVQTADTFTRSCKTNRTCSQKQVYSRFHISPRSGFEEASRFSRYLSKPAFWRTRPYNWKKTRGKCPTRWRTESWSLDVTSGLDAVQLASETRRNLSLRVTFTAVSEKVKRVLFTVHTLQYISIYHQ